MTVRSWSPIVWMIVTAAFAGAATSRCVKALYPGYGVRPPIPPLKTTPSPYRPTPRPTRTPTPTPTPLPDADGEPEP